MPRYLIEASYSLAGVTGVVAGGETAHVDAIEGLVAGAGGSMRSLHSPSDDDGNVFVVVDAPSHEVMAAVACAVTSTGLLSRYPTVVLLAADEIAAAQLSRAR